MQSVELLLDPATDAAVRAEWGALSAAGLPSQGDHRGESNAPHVSVFMGDQVPHCGEMALPEVAATLPFALRLGAVAVLGGRRLVLARLVVVDRALLDLHAAVGAALTGATGGSRHTATGRWVPHVTLARGIPADALATALEVLRGGDGALPDLVGQATVLRRWDSEARRAWTVGAG